MGLDCSHDAWHGAYSAFHRWRSCIAQAAGLPPLELMEGLFNDCTLGIERLRIERSCESLRKHPDNAHVEAHGPGTLFACLPISWDCLRPDPALHALLHHSDCDGEIDADQCAAIADRLTELMPAIEDVDIGGHVGGLRQKTQTFIDGLRRAAAAGEPLLFR